MPVVDVYDPSIGRDIHLQVYARKGKVVYQRLTDDVYDMLRSSPRRIEAVAAFAEAASTAFGEHSVDGRPPTNRRVRELMPQLMARVPSEGPTEAQRKQEHYRALLEPEEREEIERLALDKVRVRLPSPKRKETRPAFTERPLGSLRDVRPPPGY